MTTTGEAVSGESAGEVTNAHDLAEACKTWEFHVGEPPADDSPLAAVFGAGLPDLGRLLAKHLGVEQYEPGDGSENFDQDATQTLANDLEDGRWATLTRALDAEVERLRAQVERQAHNIVDLLGAVETATKARLAAEAEVKRLRVALAKINNIRNSIIGLQTMDWSEHIYPLVAALEEAGIHGMEYPEARSNYGTMLQRAVAAEDELAILRASPAGPDDGWRLHQVWSAREGMFGLEPNIQISGTGLTKRRSDREASRFWLQELGRVAPGEPLFFVDAPFELDLPSPPSAPESEVAS